MKSLYRFMFVACLVLAVVISCSYFAKPQKTLAASWEQVSTDGLGGGAGNSTAVRMASFGGKIYTTIGNYDLPPTGVKIFSSADGGVWTQVNTDGFGLATNIDGVMAVFDSALYVGTDTIGLAQAQLWKTTNGTTWTQVGTDGLGDLGNSRLIALGEFNSKLYIGMSNPITGVEVFSLDSAGNLEQVNTDGFDGTNTNNSIWALEEYNGALYASTGTTATGAQIWKTTNGTSWSAVMQGGFGDVNNGSVSALFDFGGKLYAGTINSVTGTEIWRTATGDTTWEQVNTDGFGDALTIWSGDQVAVVNNTIYVGTRNDTRGAKLFTSTNGSTWTQEGSNGFGDPANNYAMYAITFNGRIYLGISSQTGAEIWRTGTMGTLSITSSSLTEGTVGSAYSDTVDKASGTMPIAFGLTGSLPDGLTMNYSTGEISGTPTRDGTSTFTITVSDAGNPQQLASRELSIKINALATATPTPTPEVLPETGMNEYFGWAISLI